MSRLMKKFIISLFAILFSVLLLSLYLNQNFIQRYFLYQEKQDLNQICDQLLESREHIEQAIHEVEQAEDVVIARVEPAQDNNTLNERLRQAFFNQGVSLKKYWLWEQDQEDAMRSGRKMRFYSQQKLHYSLLVEYLSLEGHFIAVAKIIPSMDRTLALINQVTIVIFGCAMLVTFFLISVLVRRILSPLIKIGETARAISVLDFRTVEIQTGDELETLAEDMNHMSHALCHAHQALAQTNRQMEELLANVSHDLKTPVSLIKAYASGIRDHMDDGTFADTILAQADRMSDMTESLLNLARVQSQEPARECFSISRLLKDMIQEYEIQTKRGEIVFVQDIEDALAITGDQEAVRLILSNLISNAVKYTAGVNIMIRLQQQAGRTVFEISNQVTDAGSLEAHRLWEPFYVAEQSRNKNMSGTGLGLSLVKAAAEKHGFLCTCALKEDMIIFSVTF